MNDCTFCGKSSRAKLYCKDPLCGVISAAKTIGQPKEYGQFNATLGYLKDIVGNIDNLALFAYSVANYEASPGPKRAMLRIAEVASELSILIKTTQPL